MSMLNLANTFSERFSRAVMNGIAVLGDSVTERQLQQLQIRLKAKFDVCCLVWEKVKKSDGVAHNDTAQTALDMVTVDFVSIDRLINRRREYPIPGDRINEWLNDAPPPSKPCWLCAASHSIERCPSFLAMTLSERSALVAKAGVCWRCLLLTAPRHRSTCCRSTNVCSICRKTHHVLVHGAPKAFVTTTRKPQTPRHHPKSCHSTNGCSICLKAHHLLVQGAKKTSKAASRKRQSASTDFKRAIVVPTIVSTIVEETPQRASTVTITEITDDDAQKPQPQPTPGRRIARIIAIYSRAGLLVSSVPSLHGNA